MNKPARILVLLGVMAAAAHGQLTPEAPIKNFKLPMFDNAGVKQWDLRGEEARYFNENRVDLYRMILEVFNTDGSGEVQVEISSPHATVFPNEQTVTGEDAIRIVSKNFEITGRNFTWKGREQNATIREDVRVVFKTPIKDILK